MHVYIMRNVIPPNYGSSQAYVRGKFFCLSGNCSLEIHWVYDNGPYKNYISQRQDSFRTRSVVLNVNKLRLAIGEFCFV